MITFPEEEIERVIEVIRPLFPPEHCGSMSHDELLRKSAILFLEQQRLAKVITGQHDRFGRELL